MSNKNKLSLISITVTLLAVAFIISFNWGMNKFKENSNYKNNNVNLPSSENDRVASVLKAEELVSPNSKVTLKIEYAKSGDIETREIKVDAFAGKSKSSIEKEGYVVESITAKELVISKKIDSYAPNKYVLGVNDECFVIYKTDENGNLYIEDETSDVTDIRVPTKGDYNLLVKGSKHFQFNSRDEVEEKLGEYNS
jgi:hypothetical protein